MMRAPDFQVIPNTGMLKWARESKGYDAAAAADKLGAPVSLIHEIEGGTPVRYCDLLDLAEIYERPIACFFRSLIPPLPRTPPDRRSRSDAPPLGVPAHIQLMAARRQQSACAELLIEMGRSNPVMPVGATLKNDPELVGREYRKILGISMQDQLKWASAHAGLAFWRDAVESTGPFVFQLPLPTEQLRGFSFSDDPLCIAIASGARDSANGKIFTLMHELAHLSLRQPGLCDPLHESADARSIEGWCNHFAGALLVPPEILAKVSININQTDLNALGKSLMIAANQLKISRYALLTRLRVLDQLPRPRYEELVEAFRLDLPGGFGKSKPGRSVRSCINRNGPKMVGLVVTAVKRGAISPIDGCSYLSASFDVGRALGI